MDGSRLGLAPLTAARLNMNGAVGSSLLMPVKDAAGPDSSRGAPFLFKAANTPTTLQQQQASNPAGAEPTGRLSGGKRDHDAAVATDGPHAVDDASQNAAKKKKITYQLPHQNMEEGHFYVILGEDVDVSTARFKILSLLGEGTFGKVVEVWDRKRKEYGAVKIVRSVPKYSRDAEIEIRFMEKVRAADPNDLYCFTKIIRSFRNDGGHVCIAMPKYGPCLLDFMQKHGTFSHRHLAEIVFQCATALDFFHSEMRLMHTDLKPENMLLEQSSTELDPTTGRQQPVLPCKLRICDLGGCCDERHSAHAIVSTRHYRSPEVVLGLGWMFSTDIWSMGCIVYELFTGRLLFDTHDNLEHLHIMEKILGRLPTEFAPRAMPEVRDVFTPLGSLRPVSDPKSLARISRARPIRETVNDELLRDLVQQSLSYDRTRRITARRMATHPYVQKYYPESMQHPLHPANRPQPLPPVPTA